MMDEILSKAHIQGITQKEITKIVDELGFAESNIYFTPKVTTQDGTGYNLLVKSQHTYKSILKNPIPDYHTNMQLSLIKTMLLDSRIHLFIDDSELEEMLLAFEHIEPLYNKDDILHVGVSKDGDDYQRPKYIDNFKEILKAVKNKTYIKIVFDNSKGRRKTMSVMPYKVEYSVREDRFRLCGVSRIASVNKYIKLNIARVHEVIGLDTTPIVDSEYYIQQKQVEPIEIEISDWRNGIERIFIGLSNYRRVSTYDKETGICTMKIHCMDDDLQELLIVMLSFGPAIRVLAPQDFRDRYIQRVEEQCARFGLGGG